MSTQKESARFLQNENATHTLIISGGKIETKFAGRSWQAEMAPKAGNTNHCPTQLISRSGISIRSVKGSPRQKEL